MNLKSTLQGLAVAALLLTAGAPSAQAALTVEQRLSDFTQLVNIVERNYGPLRWKKESIGLDFKRLVSDFDAKVRAARSDSEFYRVLAQFTSSLKDAHVGAIIPSNYSASLGFVCDLVEGKVLIEKVDALRLPEILFPFKRGDQLIAIGGVSVDKLINEFSRVGDTGHEPSAKRIAAARLTSRREASGMEVPKGITTVTVLAKGAAQPVTVTVTWKNSGTPLLELDDLAAILENDTSDMHATSGASFAEELAKRPEFQMALPRVTLDEWARAGFSDMGAPKSMFNLPEGAEELPNFPVTAAIYEAAGKKIGVLRINSYGDKGLLDVVARALVVMEEQTDVLVLDQTNNPGGDVSLVSDLTAFFADKSYQDVNFLLRPSLAWMGTFQDVNEKLGEVLKAKGDDLVANALKPRFEYLENEIRDSIRERRFYTNPVSLNFLGSFGMIQPSGAVRYTKPVLLLINEFDFSGGDMFPAIMKDNGRATLFGAQTTGAGGNVREHGPLSNSHFKVNLTESLMVRPNGEFIENRGVKPDVEYTVTEDDFMNGYRGYVKAFTAEALKLVGVSKEQFEASEAVKALEKKSN